jgi:hypothetical protein
MAALSANAAYPNVLSAGACENGGIDCRNFGAKDEAYY